MINRRSQRHSVLHQLQSLRPLARAWLLAYLSTVLPRCLSTLHTLLKRKNDVPGVLHSLRRTLFGGLRPNRLPGVCAVLVGGSTLLRDPILTALAQLNPGLSQQSRLRISRATSALLAAWLSFKLLNSAEIPKSKCNREPLDYENSVDETSEKQPLKSQNEDVEAQEPILAGKSIDLTLFAATRALDIITGELWARRKSRRLRVNKWTRLEEWISRLADPSIFALSSGLVMWTWFYHPDNLPRSYNKWIKDAAAVDPRLVEVLRRAKAGHFIYGRDTGQAPLLQSMCADHAWPLSWGDPAITTPIPCEMVHMGTGPSCEVHALRRFTRALRFALAMYLPLNLLMRVPFRRKTLLHPKRLLLPVLCRAATDSLRSSTFLALFIALFYYTVCLARMRLGPRIFPSSVISPLAWDRGLAIGLGCAVCGWSILLEAPARRAEVAFFVAPRAVATLVPRRYERKYQWREGVVFSVSAAVLFTCVQEKPERVRGVFGRLLRQVLAQ